MIYSTHLYNTKKFSVTIPVFADETGDKKSEENVKRMNEFYSELKRSVIAYTESDNFPEGGRYFANVRVSDSGDKLKVSVDLKLRRKGRIISKRTLSHTWCDGVVLEKRIT